MTEKLTDLSAERRARQLKRLEQAEKAGKAVVYGVIGPVNAKILPFKRKLK